MQTSQKKGRKITQNPLTAKGPVDMFSRLLAVIFPKLRFLCFSIMSALKMGLHCPPIGKMPLLPNASRMCRRRMVLPSPPSHHPCFSQEW